MGLNYILETYLFCIIANNHLKIVLTILIRLCDNDEGVYYDKK